jgi:hypothetical protein
MGQDIADWKNAESSGQAGQHTHPDSNFPSHAERVTLPMELAHNAR